MRMMKIIAVLFALTVTQLGHAESGQPEIADSQSVQSQDTDPVGNLLVSISEPWVDFAWNNKDVDCLARNIYYEAANESEEGKVAVGIVTINRVKDDRYANTICQVVHQHMAFYAAHTIVKTVMINTGWFGITHAQQVQQRTVKKVAVCQFSWTCMHVRKPQIDDARWIESQRIARELLADGYIDYRKKYADAMYFHSIHIHPQWARHMHRIAKTGGHIFYASTDQ